VRSGSVTIPGHLVPYLRVAIKREISFHLAILQAEIDTELDPETYTEALGRLQSATALFDLIGLETRSDQTDVDLDLTSSARLLLKVLDTQHRIEVQRLEDAAAGDIHPHLPRRGVAELGVLVSLVRQYVAAQSSFRPWMQRSRTDG
jgi:hypothetical protein